MAMQSSSYGLMNQKNTPVTSTEKKSAQTFERVQNQSQSAAPFCGEKTARPTQDQISTRAYELYVAGGSAKGHCKENWNQAEKELKNELGDSSPVNS